ITNTINTANSNNTARAVDYYSCPENGLLTNPIISALEQLLEKEEQRKVQLLQLLKALGGTAEESTIRKKVARNKDYFYEFSDGEYKSLNRDNKQLTKLIRKEIAAVLLKDCIRNCTILNDLLASISRNDKSDLYKKGLLYSKAVAVANKIALPANRLGVLGWSDDRIIWMHEKYELNSYMPEHLRFRLGNGMLVRSKSEQYIGERLVQRGVMFRYDSAFNIDGKTIYPDFVILTPDGRIVIWEHFGLTSSNEYLLKSMNKIEMYRKAGFAQHKNLICTREEDILDLESIDEIIDRFGLA
ncbi:MAG: hypothetical protein HUJ63_11295, partial [Enterococcus sp.]|nr:hypothetical protein [Enterococcus sp.]